MIKYGGNKNFRGLNNTRKRKEKRKRQKGGDIDYKDITLGILSYKDCKTVLNTLESYKNNGLLDLVNTVIFFQELGDFERSIAEKYNIKCIGSESNIGLQKALLELINNTNTKYFISAQSDFELIKDKETVKKVLDDAIKLLENDDIQQVKLGDYRKSTTFNASLNIWDNEYKNGPKDKNDYPWKLEILGYLDNPEETFPNVYKIANYNYKWYISTTKDNKWSDHIFITKTDFMKNTIVPIINSNPSDINNVMIFEESMDKYLETHIFNIASNIDGLFIHNRLDRKSDNSICDLNQIGGNEKNKAYVINLDKRKDRWDHIQNNLKHTDLDLERVSAVYDKDGHKGCALSIQKIVQMAKDNNMKTVLFIEDDNIITDDFNQRWKLTKEWLDNHMDKWEIFNGGPNMHSTDQKFELIAHLSNDVTLLKAEQIINTNFIYINSSVYDKILNIKNSGNHYPIDNNLGNSKEFNVIFINPFLGIQSKVYSNINNKVKDQDEHINSIQNYLTSMFGKTKGYVINLEKRKEKYDRILKEFENTSIELERFNAIEHTNGHVGCGESHKAIVRKAKEENKDTLLILEDDCKIIDIEKFNKRWPIIKQWLDNNMDKWEVFNGGPVDPVGEKKMYEVDSENILYSLEAAKCTQFMYINKSAYDKILEWTYDKDWLYDYGFVNTPKFKNLAVIPQLTTQHNGFSDTENHNKVYKGGQQEVCNISYFTVSTKDKSELQRLKSSAEKFGWKLEVLGLEQNTDRLGWGNTNNKNGNYGDFSIKLAEELKYVSTKNDDDIVLFTDAWDVVCIGDCKTLYEKFLTFNKDIVFGAEKECSPDRDKKDLYKNKDIPFPYLNSGFFIGKAGVIKKYLEHIDGEKDDQRFWTNVFLKNEDTIGIDSYATMALQTWDTDDKNYQFQDNTFTYLETNTNPIFIHSNGWQKDKLNLFTPLIQNGGKKKKMRKTRRKSKKTSKRKSRKMKGGENTKIHYITISTKDKPELQSLIKSAKKYNWDLKVLGMEIGTNQLGHHNKQFGMKLRYVKEYLKKCDPEDLLLLTDAWDVNVFGTKEEMLERYKKFNTSIIFNAEKFCWPDESRKNEYDSLNEEFPFLNSGGYIGKVKDLAMCLNDYNNEDNIDDQRFWTDQYFKHRDLIKLDLKNDIFICTPATNRTDYSIENGKLKYKNAYPIVLHRNGPGKENYLDLVQTGGNNSILDELTNKLTFVVYTHSDFDDVLELFLKQYNKCLLYFPLSIGTNNKKLIEDKYSNQYSFIKNIYTYNDSDEYYDRIKSILSNINTKYVLFNHEVNVIQNPVPIENIKKIIDEMESKTMDQLRLSDSGEKNPVYSEDTFVHKIEGPYYISIQPGIWKKDILLDIVTKFPKTKYLDSESAEIQEYVKQFNNYYSTTVNDIHSDHVNVSVFILFPIIHMTSKGKYRRDLKYVNDILKENNIDPNIR